MSQEKPVPTIYSTFFNQEYPGDLIFMLEYLALGIIAIFLPILNIPAVRYVLTIPIVLFIPGYCLIAALFPKESDMDLIERILLSIGLSIAVVPLIGLGLNFTPWGIRLEPIVISVAVFTLVMILVAQYRRGLLPSEERFSIRFFALAGAIREEMVPSDEGRVDKLLNIILAVVAIIAIVTIAFVIIFPQNGERFSEFFILNENKTAAYYPGHIYAGEVYPMYIGVGNQEQRNVTYTVETWFLQTEFDTASNSTRIITMDPVERFSFALGYNETTILPYNLSVEKTGYDRVEFLLFNETVPGTEVTGNDRINASYRDLHIWITVE